MKISPLYSTLLCIFSSILLPSPELGNNDLRHRLVPSYSDCLRACSFYSILSCTMYNHFIMALLSSQNTFLSLHYHYLPEQLMVLTLTVRPTQGCSLFLRSPFGSMYTTECVCILHLGLC